MTIVASSSLRYEYDQVSDTIYLVGIFDGKVRRIPVDFRPRFYVERDYANVVADMEFVKSVREVELLTMDTKVPVVEVQVRQPKDVPKIRKVLNEMGIKTYQADVPYVKVLQMNDIIEMNYTQDNVAFFDIELWDKEGFPKDYGKTKFMCIGAISGNNEWWWGHIDDYEDEKELLIDFVEWLMEHNISIVVGWNVTFDYEHTLHRLWYLRVPEKYVEYWKMLQPIDLMDEYKSAVKGLSSYSLEEVSKYEKLGKIKHRDKMIWQMNYDELFEYNMYDVELLKILEDKYGFVQVKMTLANVMNMTIDAVSSPVQVWDMLIMKRLRELGYVAWDTPSPRKNGIKLEDLQYEGALVKEPEIGLWKNVAYVDFVSLYPSIVINEKVEIQGFNGEVLPYLMKKYFDLRQEYKKKAKEYKAKGDLEKSRYYNLLQGAVKIVINGGYGALAYCSIDKDTMFRFFKLENAAYITAKGREIAKTTWMFLEKTFPVKVLYIDTDGLQVWLGDDLSREEAMEFAETLVEAINEYIAPYKIKLEEVMEKVMYFGEYNKKERRWVGIKKKYVAIDENGEYLFRGLEIRRGDTSPFQKRVIMEVIDMIFKEGKGAEEIMEYMKDIKKRLFKGEFDEELIIAKAVTKDESEYKNLPPHIKSLKKAKRLGYDFPDGRVKFVWSSGFPEPVWDGRDVKKIPKDYKRYWEYVMTAIRKFIVALTISELKGEKKPTKRLKEVWKFFDIKVSNLKFQRGLDSYLL